MRGIANWAALVIPAWRSGTTSMTMALEDGAWKLGGE